MDEATRQRKERGVWDRLAAGYDARTIETFAKAYELSILRTCAVLMPQDRVLEIGCGTGLVTIGVSPCAETIIGTDISPEMIGVARQKAESLGIANVEFQVHDGYSLPYDDASFDAVLIFNVLHFVKEPDRILKEAHRLLKPSGHVISATDCYAEAAPAATRLKLMLQRVLKWVGVIPFAWYYTKEDLRQLFERNGFHVIEMEDLHSDPINAYVLARKRQ